MSNDDSFWSGSQWEDWSNELADLIPDGEEARWANPEGVQEQVILDCFRAYIRQVLAARKLVDRWEHGALRWADPLPVPREVAQLREVLEVAE